MGNQRSRREPIFRDLRLTGEYADRVLLDEDDNLLYFAPPGERVPKRRSDYLAGVGIAVLIIGVWVACFVVSMVLQWTIDGFNGVWLGFVVPGALMMLFALAAPFIRRRRSAEGKLYDRLRQGDIIAMRPTELGRELATHAAGDRRGYYEQAIELARADALRHQAEQMRELQGASAVAGSHAGRINRELAEYAVRLERAAADREDAVRGYLAQAHHG